MNAKSTTGGILLSALVCAKASAAFEASYTADYFSVLDGGLKSGSAYLDNLSLNYTKDGFLFEQARLGVQAIYNNSAELSAEYVGDAQAVSNIDNSHMIELFELWYEWSTATGSVWTVGFVDANSIYDVTDTASLFVHSAHGIGTDIAQSGENGPSIFPVTSLSLNFQRYLGEDTRLSLGIFDATPGDLPDNPTRPSFDLGDGVFAIGEIELQKDSVTYSAGAWYYSQEAATFENREEHNKGAYFSADVKCRALDCPLSWWVRVGLAEGDVNQFGAYLGGGIVLTGIVPGRPEDKLGLAVAHAENSSAYRSQYPDSEDLTSGGETAIELTYEMPISDHITLQPDIQYIVNPGGEKRLDNALVTGLRLVLTY